jgi:Zn-dependent protease
MGIKLQISFGFCLFSALLILLLPLQWWVGASLAAMIHELIHLIAVLAFGGTVYAVSLGFGEARIEAELPGTWKQVISSLAGPLGSLLLLSLSNIYPEMALCGLVQGAYNLLPIYPLDGGRAIRAVFSDPVCKGIEMAALVVSSGISLWVSSVDPAIGIFLLISLWLPVIRRKNSCKEGNLAVQ